MDPSGLPFPTGSLPLTAIPSPTASTAEEGGGSAIVGIMGGVTGCTVALLAAVLAVFLWRRHKGQNVPQGLGKYSPEGEEGQSQACHSQAGPSQGIRAAGSIHGTLHSYSSGPKAGFSNPMSQSSQLSGGIQYIVTMPPNLGVASEIQSDPSTFGSGAPRRLQRSVTPPHGTPHAVFVSYNTARSLHHSSHHSRESSEPQEYGDRHQFTDQTYDGASLVGGVSMVSDASTRTAQAVHNRVAAAVKELQENLQDDLHEEQLQLFRRLGQGGFGTVYHGLFHISPRICYRDECAL